MSSAHLVYYWTYAVQGNIITFKCLPFNLKSGSSSRCALGVALGWGWWLLVSTCGFWKHWIIGCWERIHHCVSTEVIFVVYWETSGTPFFSPIRKKKYRTAGTITYYPVHGAIGACPQACYLSKQSSLQIDSAFKDFPANSLHFSFPFMAAVSCLTR